MLFYEVSYLYAIQYQFSTTFLNQRKMLILPASLFFSKLDMICQLEQRKFISNLQEPKIGRYYHEKAIIKRNDLHLVLQVH